MKNLIILFLSIVSILKMEAQIFQSPNSRYGLGELRENTPVRNQSIGYCQSSIMDTNFNGITFLNPASNAKNKSFAIDGGVSINFYHSKTSTESFKNKDYYLQSIAISIPLWKKREWGLNIGIAPISKIGYSIKSGTANDTQFWKGKGGFNNYSIGIGVKIVKGLYAGTSINYMYGRDELNQELYFNDVTQAAITKTRTSSGGGIYFNSGLIYQLNVNKNKDMLAIGTTFRSQTSLTSSADIIAYTFYPNENYVIGDTLQTQLNKKGTFTLPMRYSIGASYMFHHKWLFATDYVFTQFSKFQLNEKVNELKDLSTLSLGVQYNASGGVEIGRRYNLPFYKKVSYRAGLKYTNTYYQNQPKMYGVCGGFGIPVGEYGTYLDIGLEYGKFGSTSTSEINTEYFKLSFGFRVFDRRWFERIKTQ